MTDFRDMATANQSCWMWQLDMDGVAGELEGAIGSFFWPRCYATKAETTKQQPDLQC